MKSTEWVQMGLKFEIWKRNLGTRSLNCVMYSISSSFWICGICHDKSFMCKTVILNQQRTIFAQGNLAFIINKAFYYRTFLYNLRTWQMLRYSDSASQLWFSIFSLYSSKIILTTSFGHRHSFFFLHLEDITKQVSQVDLHSSGWD